MRPEAHFYMPSVLNALACAYTPSVDFHVVREALRRERARRRWSLDKLEEVSGINRATIHSIENMKREPDLQPKLETIETLATAMEMTISLSLLPNVALQTETGESTLPAPNQLEESGASAPVASSSSPDTLAAFKAFGGALGREIGKQLAQRDGQRKNPRSPRKKSKRRRDDAGDARRRA